MQGNPQSVVAKLASGKPVAIFGAGSSGIAARRVLEKHGIESVIYSETPTADSDTANIFDTTSVQKHNLVVYSPAFRPDHKWISLADSYGLVAICEPDLSALFWQGKIVAITGTNGKTTLTTFLERALKHYGIDAYAVGNIGRPLCDLCAEYSDTSNKTAVYELSSFQTSRLRYLKPDAVLWTNFAPDHLDWHKDMAEYFSAKVNLANSAKGGILLVGQDVMAFADSNAITLPENAKIPTPIAPADCPAPFNTSIQSQNYSMAIEYLRVSGFDTSILKDATENFDLPKYRFGNYTQACGVKFYNDSKATNAHAAIAALCELQGTQNLVWLGGGKDKYCDNSELVSAVKESAIAAVLIGQTAEKLKVMFDEIGFPAYICNTMQEAVFTSARLAGDGGSVLFSPAFSSFGMFSSYAERGKSFQNEVLCLKNLK